MASAIYAWALVPSRRYATSNPLRLVELPPNDEKPRLRVAFALEAAQLLEALAPRDAVPYAIAFYAGLRRAEIDRLEWPELLDGSADRFPAPRHAREERSGSMSGRPRPWRSHCKESSARRGYVRAARRPAAGCSRRQSCPASSRLARPRRGCSPTARITLHECRHTYASLLMAAGYTLKELMEFMGHADLQMVNRYVKLLPDRAKRTSRTGSPRTYVAQPNLAARRLDEVPRVALHPAFELGQWDEDELSAQHDLEVRLHLALEVVDAHAQRRGRFLSGHRVPGHCCEGSGRDGSHLSGVVVGNEGIGLGR